MMPRRAPVRRKATLTERAAAQQTAKDAVRDELHARKLFPADVAAQVGVSEQEMTRKLAITDRYRHVTLGDLRLLEPELIEGVLTRLLADLGFVVVQVPADAALTLDLVEHHEAATQAVHSHLLAVADKRVTRIEGADLEEKALREAQLAIALMVLGRRAQKDGVVDAPARPGH